MNDDLSPDHAVAELIHCAELDDETRAGIEELPTAVCWRYLSGEQAAQHWAELVPWVRWFLDRYRIKADTVPPCWYRHGSMIEELSALHTAWLVAYSSKAPGAAPLDWHSSLHYAIQRLQAWTQEQGSCRSVGKHEDHRPHPGWDDHDLAVVIGVDLHTRRRAGQ